MRAPSLIVLLLGACALVASPDTDARRTSANAQKLYDTLEQASEQYREGVAQLRKGEAGPGRESIRKASAKLLDAARRCADTRGCDGARFLAA